MTEQDCRTCAHMDRPLPNTYCAACEAELEGYAPRDTTLYDSMASAMYRDAAPAPSGDMKQHKHEAKVLPMQAAMTAVHEVLLYGGNKYVPGNERNAGPADMAAYDDALFRHWQARRLGEVFDPGSGYRHLAHLAWNALFLLEQELRGIVNPQWAKEPCAELVKAAQKGEKK